MMIDLEELKLKDAAVRVWCQYGCNAPVARAIVTADTTLTHEARSAICNYLDTLEELGV